MIFLIIASSILLVANWFREGLMMASAESGIPFNNLLTHFQIVNHSWASPVVGNNTGMITASMPTYALLYFLESLGLDPVLLQFLFFTAIIIVAHLATYLFIVDYFTGIDKKNAYLGSLFYTLNPLLIFIVWNRFLLSHMVFFTLIPVVFLIFFKGVKNAKLRYSILTSFALTIFSYALTSPAFTVSIWMFISLFGFIYSIKLKQSLNFYIKYIFLAGVSFLFLNFWWIFPTAISLVDSLKVANNQGLFTSSGNLESLSLISQKEGSIVGILRFVHLDLTKSGSIWMQIYSNPLFIVFELLLTLLILLSIFAKKNIKKIYVVFCLYLFSVFLMKGNSEPLGEVFNLLFVNIKPLQVLRNPFEKVGFFYVFFSSMLLAISTDSYLKKKSTFLVVLILVIILGFPLLTRDAFDINFGNSNVTARIQVPDYYQNLDEAITNRDTRLLTLPLDGEGITYSWKHPFNGIESSNTLINKANISLNTTIPFYTNLVNNLYEYQNTESIFLFTKLFNVDQILLRGDIDHISRKMINPQKSERLLDSFLGTKLSNKQDFGDLSLYDVKESEFWPKFYISNNFIYTNSKNVTKLADINGLESKLAILNESLYKPQTLGTIYIEPERFFTPRFPRKRSFYSDEELINDLVHLKYLPGDRLYPLILLKEKIESPSKNHPAAWLKYQIDILGKRAIEVCKVNTDKSTSRYLKYLQDIIHAVEKDKLNHELNENTILDSLLTQEALLSRCRPDLSANLSKFLETQNIKPIHSLPDSGIQKYIIFQFKVSIPENYDVAVNHIIQNSQKIYLNGDLIDNGNLKSIYLDKGLYEIAFLVDQDIELDTIYEKENLVVTNAEQIFEQLSPNKNVQISFDYRFLEGKNFQIEFSQDIDSLSSPIFSHKLEKHPTQHEYLKYANQFTTSVGIDELRLHIKPAKEESCSIDFLNREICMELDSKYKVEIRDLKISSYTKPEATLIKHDIPSFSETKVSFQKISNTKYEVYIEKESEFAELLAFSELFNLGWEISDVSLNDNHVLSNLYANGWILTKKGNYKLTVIYKPESYLLVGKLISSISVLMFLFLNFYLRKHEIN